MTNVQIIEAAKAKLVADQKIKPGEEIHTYKLWRKLGYQVFRGEKAVACLTIWQNYQEAEDEGKEDEEKKKRYDGKMRMRKAYFFSSSQVFALEGEE